MAVIDQNLAQELEAIPEAQDLIGEIFRRFGSRAAIGTSGQLTGTVMVDLAVKASVKPRVFTIDTLRLFPETYELFDAIEKKYGIKIEKIQPDPVKLQKMISEDGEFLFFDSKAKQEFCCNLRKVEPNERALDTVDVWLTGLRVDQSAARAQTAKKCEIIFHGKDKRPILKVAPLIDWNEKKLRSYMADNGVPVHKLLSEKAGLKDGWYYESLGCVICTTPIGPNEPRRAGRWRWFNHLDGDKECGIHAQKTHKDEV